MEDLSLRKPPSLAITAGATTPVGETGAVVWSTIEGRLLTYDGARWVPIMIASAHRLARFTGTERKALVDYMTLTTTSFPPSLQHFMPFIFHRKTEINSLHLEVTSAATGSLSIGIYNNQVANNFDYPYQLVWGATNAVDVSTTGVKTVSLSPALILDPGIIYWVSIICNAAPALRAGHVVHVNFQNTGNFSIGVAGLTLAGTGTTLVNPAPTSGYGIRNNSFIVVAYT